MGIDPMNNISIIIRILFAVTLFQQEATVVMSPTVYDNLKSNGTVVVKTPGSKFD
jgi:hypothetical protein